MNISEDILNKLKLKYNKKLKINIDEYKLNDFYDLLCNLYLDIYEEKTINNEIIILLVYFYEKIVENNFDEFKLNYHKYTTLNDESIKLLIDDETSEEDKNEIISDILELSNIFLNNIFIKYYEDKTFNLYENIILLIKTFGNKIYKKIKIN